LPPVPLLRQAFKEGFATACPPIATLLELNDAAAHLPVRGGQNGVDGTGGLLARFL